MYQTKCFPRKKINTHLIHKNTQNLIAKSIFFPRSQICFKCICNTILNFTEKSIIQIFRILKKYSKHFPCLQFALTMCNIQNETISLFTKMLPTKVVQPVMLFENPVSHKYNLNLKKNSSKSSNESVSWYLQ